MKAKEGYNWVLKVTLVSRKKRRSDLARVSTAVK